MNFAFPWGLLGLLSLPVILGLHLLRERHKRVIVSHLELWSFLEHEIHAPRPKRLPVTPLLLMDLAIAALLSLALAQPRVTIPLQFAQARHRVLLVDVSASMRASEGLSTRYQQAQTAAAALLDASGPQDIVTVVAFGRFPHAVGDSRHESLESITTRLAELPAGETGHALPEALALGLAALDGSLPAEFHIFTDGAFPEAALTGLAAFEHPLNWHFAGQPVDNQAVVELNTTPLGGGRYQIFTRIANFGRQPVERLAVLQLNGEPLERARLEIPADSSVAQVWEVSVDPAQSSAFTVTLQGGDNLSEDDSASVGLQPGGELRAVLVAENPAPLEQALLAVPEVEVETLTPEAWAAQPDLPPAALTVFRGILPERWPDGLSLVVEPPAGAAAAGAPALTSGASQEIPANAPLRVSQWEALTAGIDFGGVRWSRAKSLRDLPPGFTPLLQAGDVLLLLRGSLESGSGGSSRVLVLLADMARGNFTRHPAFPILMANIVQSARQAPLPGSVEAGAPVYLPPTGQFQRLEVSAPVDAPAELSDWPAAWEDTSEPGLYHFRFLDAQGEATEHVLGVNAGDEVESDLRPREWTRQPAPGSTSARSSGGPDGAVDDRRLLDLMPWLLAAAVLILMGEAYLAWR